MKQTNPINVTSPFQAMPSLPRIESMVFESSSQSSCSMYWFHRKVTRHAKHVPTPTNVAGSRFDLTSSVNVSWHSMSQLWHIRPSCSVCIPTGVSNVLVQFAAAVQLKANIAAGPSQPSLLSSFASIATYSSLQTPVIGVRSLQ